MYKKSAGKEICVPIYRNALKEHFFSHHRHSADLFCHYKIKQIFYMFNIFMFFFTQELQLHADLG